MSKDTLVLIRCFLDQLVEYGNTQQWNRRVSWVSPDRIKRRRQTAQSSCALLCLLTVAVFDQHSPSYAAITLYRSGLCSWTGKRSEPSLSEAFARCFVATRRLRTGVIATSVLSSCLWILHVFFKTALSLTHRNKFNSVVSFIYLFILSIECSIPKVQFSFCEERLV